MDTAESKRTCFLVFICTLYPKSLENARWRQLLDIHVSA